MRQGRRWLRGVWPLVVLAVLTGCGGFFVPPDNSSGGGGDDGGGGSTGTARVYVANQGASSLSAYTVGDGTLTQISGFPMALGFIPVALAVSPNNNFLYIAGTSSISVYAINSDGTLTAKNNGAVASVASLDISPDGQWLFGLDQFQNMLDEYKIDSTSGALSLQDNPVYTLGDGETATPKMVKVAPTGNYVFAALGMGGEVVFTLNTTSGAVAQVQHLSVGSVQTNDNALAVDSTTAHLYIARSGNNGGIAVYTVGANGVLNSISGSPFAAGGQPYSLTMDTSGKYLYAANRTDGTISGYTIGTDAGLTALANSPFSSGSLVGSLAVDSSGLYLFAGSEGGSPDLGMFSFDTTALGQINLIKSITTDTATSPAGVIAVAATH